MTDEKDSTTKDEPGMAGDAWHAVGQQFRELGDSLFAAINASLDDPQTQGELHKVKSSLNEAAEQISAAVTEAADSEEGQRVKEEVGKAADTLRTKGEEVYTQVKPELVSAFRQLRSELDTIISQMEPEPTTTTDDSETQKTKDEA
jgi:hypothetical protein